MDDDDEKEDNISDDENNIGDGEEAYEAIQIFTVCLLYVIFFFLFLNVIISFYTFFYLNSYSFLNLHYFKLF